MSETSNNQTVFISYAREDSDQSERLYKSLKSAGLIPWRDKDAIKPGQNWKIAIRKGIKNSRYFMPLFSTKSVEKIGYVQKEFKYAIDNFDKFPESEIYIIPVRLDNCQIPYEKLEEIQYVDLFPDWDNGIKQILDSMGVEFLEANGIQVSQEETWKMGLSEKDWNDLLKAIQNQSCIPVIGQGLNVVQSSDGKTWVSFFKDVVNKLKIKYKVPLEDLYEMARVYSLEDSSQLARLAQFLEISESEEGYPRDVLSELLKQIKPTLLSTESNSPYNILASLDLPIYLTTNYDTLMEETLGKDPTKKPVKDFCKWSDSLNNYVKAVKIRSVFDEAGYSPSTEKPLVYHINGDVTLPGSMVLTERDYFEFVAYFNKNEDKDILPSVLRTQIPLSSLLFIGYNLEDINFRAIFQAFLSFMSSIDRQFRKPSIAVQIPPSISNKNQIKMQKYLERYTLNMFEVRVYWGTTQDFITELGKRWNNFRNNTNSW